MKDGAQGGQVINEMRCARAAAANKFLSNLAVQARVNRLDDFVFTPLRSQTQCFL